jgi:hypothetical protein
MASWWKKIIYQSFGGIDNQEYKPAPRKFFKGLIRRSTAKVVDVRTNIEGTGSSAQRPT